MILTRTTRLSLFCICLLIMATGCNEKATDGNAYYVDASVSRSGDGTANSPFKTMQEGMNAAQPGDIVWVEAGEYSDLVETVRDGKPGYPITLRSNPPVEVPDGAGPGWMPEDESQRVWIRREDRGIDVIHSHIVIDGINVDGLWHGNAFIDDDGIFRDTTRTGVFPSGTTGIIRINQGADSVTLRNLEVKNNQLHLVRAHGNNTLIDNTRIHRGIARTRNTPAPAPRTVTHDDYFRDAHGIEASHSHGLTISNTYIGYVSGDCVQLGRSDWGDFLVENSHFEIEPISEPILGLEPGTWFGEDHFDTKTPNRGADGVAFNKGVTFRNSTFNGTRHSRYQSGAVFNLKEGVDDILIENNVFYDNRTTFRLRRPTTGYVIRNNIFYDNESAIWFEGRRDDEHFHSSNITNVQVLNNTFYDNEIAIRETVGGAEDAVITGNIFANGPNELRLDGPVNRWENNLFHEVASARPDIASEKSLIADPMFVDPANGDFRMHPDSPALQRDIGARPE